MSEPYGPSLNKIQPCLNHTSVCISSIYELSFNNSHITVSSIVQTLVEFG